MPNFNGMGPNNQGPMTGRGLGPCGGGRGFGRGFGRGRGFAWRARALPIQQVQPTAITEKQEKQFLEQDLEALKEEMKEVEKRLKEFKE